MTENPTDQPQDGNAQDQEMPAYVTRLQKEMSRPKIEDEEAVSPIWLITFTDIMALMLTFFVLLYAMARPDEIKWDEMTGALNREFNEFYAQEFESGSIDALNIDKVDFRRALDLNYLRGLITESLSDTEGADRILFMPQKDVLLISMPDDLFFESGQAEVSTEGKRVLFTLGGVLSRIKNKIEIVGHADPRPIQNENSPFSSNWDLSLVRASNVANVLTSVGYDRPILVRGSSAGRFDDLPQDMALAERYDLARRVDIVILKNDGRQRLMVDGDL